MRRPTFDLAGGRRVLEKLHQLVLEYDFAFPGGKVLADSKSVRLVIVTVSCPPPQASRSSIAILGTGPEFCVNYLAAGATGPGGVTLQYPWSAG